MDTFDLTQSGAQVQAIINDANNMKNAGSQSTVPATDGILLKDTNGQYHKIDKSSFTEAVRNTLANLLVNNDKGSTISQIAAIASGDFGSITPANLASVLGGLSNLQPTFMPIRNNQFGGDCNDIVETGWYKVSNAPTLTNCPGGNGSFILHIKHADGYYIQYCHSRAADSFLYCRACNNGSWGIWEMVPTNIPSFYKDYSTLDSLASALGVYSKGKVQAQDGVKVAKYPTISWTNYIFCITVDNETSTYYPVVCLLMISKDKKVLVKKLYENGSQYNTLKPNYKTDGTYLYIQRVSGVSFTISPIGSFAGDLLDWTAVSSYPETDADVTVI